MRAEISFDLVMDDNMPFVEGCYRLENRDWQVFMFRKSRGIEEIGVRRDLVWMSGITGINIIVEDGTIINQRFVIEMLSDVLGVTEWSEVHGPDSIQLR